MNLLELSQRVGVQGFLHCCEADKLAELAVNREILEVGSYCGLSAWLMAITAKSVTAVDTFGAATDGQRQTGGLTTLDAFKAATARFRNVRYVVGTSEEVHRTGVLGSFDFVFIDATHTYPEVLADINRWWPRVRPGGVMALHDYGHHSFPGVKEAADEIFGPAPSENVCVTLRWVEKR